MNDREKEQEEQRNYAEEKSAELREREQSQNFYIGDGVDAFYTPGWPYGQIMLKTERETGTHFIALEPPEFDMLLRFAKRIGWLEKGQILK